MTHAVRVWGNSLASDTVESTGFVLNVRIEICPELDEEKCVLGTFVVQLFEASFFLREFIVNLSDIDSLKRNERSDIFVNKNAT